VYFRITGYGAEKIDDVRRRFNQIRPVERALQGSARRTAVQDVKRREQSGPLGGGWPNASAGRSHQVSFEYNPEAS
jgi:hypothetical protein